MAVSESTFAPLRRRERQRRIAALRLRATLGPNDYSVWLYSCGEALATAPWPGAIGMAFQISICWWWPPTKMRLNGPPIAKFSGGEQTPQSQILRSVFWVLMFGILKGCEFTLMYVETKPQDGSACHIHSLFLRMI